MKNRISAWIVLGLITIIAGLGLAVTNEVTKEPIKQQAIAAEEKAKKAVMPEADSFEEIVLEDGTAFFIAKQGDEVVGYVSLEEAKGYGGMIEVVTGVKEDGTVTGINVGGSSFAETPGLGAKARDTAFTDQFKGKQSPVRLGDPTNANAVESITAATRTSNAVLNAVNASAKKINLYLNPDSGIPAVAEGTPYFGEAEGFVGPVYVVVTVKDDGTISGLKVGDERFAESDGYGAAALESDFGQRFVGKTFPLTLENVDGISGATVTTKAVINAANLAFESKSVLLPEGTTYAGEAEGFVAPVYVEVSVKDDGAITALKIGDARFAESDGYGAAALAPEFAAQFVGKTMPVSVEDIEAISGATVTTKAVLSAMNTAYEQKNIIGESVTPAEPVATTEITATPEPVAIPENAVTASKQGFAGPVAVTVAFDEAQKISFIKIGDEQFAETKNFGLKALEDSFQAQFIGKLLPLTLRKADDAVTDNTIDGISGATVTSRAVVDAINELHAQQYPVPVVTAEPIVVIPGLAIEVTREGFMGPVTVRVQFNEDGTIASVALDEVSFKETPGYGALALDEAYLASFTGLQAPLYIKGVGEGVEGTAVSKLQKPDANTSATKTTQAIVEAINEAYALFQSQSSKTVTKQGFMGPVSVAVSMNEDGSIKSVKVLEEGFVETPGYGALALTDSFVEQFIGKVPPLAIKKAEDQMNAGLVAPLTNPDTQTSATVTLQAVIDAINEAAQ
ncbi:MAG: FMN-binding protein [Clostridiales bacterium]|jgi:electron transport complex protein RnfG|nr:FMN-binding protein [Clostridiales bacterium]